MSPAPGTETLLSDEAVARTPASASGVAFIAGVTERGPLVPTEVNSMDAYAEKFGPRTTKSAAMFDWADTFFHTGGSRLIVTRRVGPAAVKASANIYDQSGSIAPGDVSLVVTATNPGEDGDKLNYAVVVDGTNFYINITHDDDGSLIESPVFADRDEAVAYFADNEHVTLALGASAEDPRAATATTLAGGVDDRASIVDADLDDTLALLEPDLGPGQVAVPNATTTAAHQAILAACAEGFRSALLDFPDTGTVATLTAAADALKDGETDHAGAVFGPWAVVPGVAAGTDRTVPWSAVQAGMIARNDAAGLSPGQPAAGRHGIPAWVIGLSQEPWSEADRNTLNLAGFNVVRVVRRQLRTYGNRTLVDSAERPTWVEFSGARVTMLIANRADEILEDAMFNVLDGRGFNVSEVGNQLAGLLLSYYPGALHGATPDEAFFVDIGPTVNTPAKIAARELNAVIELKTNPAAERVRLVISKQAIA